jgi:hypothetical protein
MTWVRFVERWGEKKNTHNTLVEKHKNKKATWKTKT